MQEIIEFLSKDFSVGVSWSDERIKTPFEIKPLEFLKFAEKDLEEKTEKSRINALSNIKRGIDCQLDSLLILLGHYDIAKKK